MSVEAPRGATISLHPQPDELAMPELGARLTAALADRYRIERELGRGGMATVYLAEDLKHHRQVAFKVFHPELALGLGSGPSASTTPWPTTCLPLHRVVCGDCQRNCEGAAMSIPWMIILMCCAMASLPSRATAQHEVIDKGTLLIGGSASVSGLHQDGNESNTFSISLGPMVGAFVARGLAVWGTALFSHTSASVSSVDTWGLGPGMAYYFPRVLGRAYPFVGIESLFSWGSGHIASGSESLDYHSTLIRLRPSAGLLFMLIPHVGIEGELYLLRSWTTRDPDTVPVGRNTTQYGFSAGVTAFVF
jgi:hypothetical protein